MSGSLTSRIGSLFRRNPASSPAPNAVKPNPGLALRGTQTVLGGVAAQQALEGLNRLNDALTNDVRLAAEFGGEITFPEDLLRNDTTVPFMSMEFKAYRRRSIREAPFFQSQMKIRLPIPDNILDSQSVTYDRDNLGPAIGSAMDALSGSGNVINSPAAAFSTLSNAAGPENIINQGIAQGLQAAQILGRSGPLQGIGSAVNALTGLSINPFQTILFKSPDFKRHSFTWKFAPKNRVETERLNLLINTFKYHSLPGLRAGVALFSYPEVLEINFRPTSRYLYRFKTCVVDSITVNYAPNNPSFFKTVTGAPTAVTVQLNLQEIEIWTKEDIARGYRLND